RGFGHVLGGKYGAGADPRSSLLAQTSAVLDISRLFHPRQQNMAHSDTFVTPEVAPGRRLAIPVGRLATPSGMGKDERTRAAILPPTLAIPTEPLRCCVTSLPSLVLACSSPSAAVVKPKHQRREHL